MRGVDAELGEMPRRWRRSEEEGLRCHGHGDLGSWDSWMVTGLLGVGDGRTGREGTEAVCWFCFDVALFVCRK